VAEPHKSYTGETRFPLVLQNIHRYFFYLGLVLNAVLTYDAVVAFRNHATTQPRGPVGSHGLWYARAGRKRCPLVVVQPWLPLLPSPWSRGS
jgi:hypothetical protein